MKIFITGSTGFIGQHLVEYYKDHNVYEHKRYMDLSAKLDYFKPDLIINCAADIYNAEAMFVPNVLWTHTCLEYVKENSKTKMVHIGSSSEYGPLAHPGKETDRVNPIDMYQATKGAATILCQGYARHYGLDISIARPYSVYGPLERPHRLFPRLWKAFYKNEPMVLSQGFHDFIYIDDFVRGIATLATTENKPSGDIVNFGSGTQYSNFVVYEMFKQVSGLSGDSVTIDNRMAKTFESSTWVCDTSYAKTAYKFEIRYTLEQGIEEFINKAQY